MLQVRGSGWAALLCRATMLIAPLVLLPHPGRAQQGDDLQAQILYAWYTEDSGRLRALREGLRQDIAGERPSAASRYHLAHIDYRLGLLRSARHDPAAREPLQECVDQLAAVPGSDGPSAEALILQAACYVQLIPLRGLQGRFMRSRAAAALARAAQISAHDPRIELVRALQLLQDPGDPDAIIPELLGAAAMFDHESLAPDNGPGWGDAETYLLLGHALRLRGDLVSARNWIEKALIAAPDYRAAARELALLGH